MRILVEIPTQHGVLRLVEGTVEVLHEIPLRNSLISSFPGLRPLHNVSAISSSGRNERTVGEIDLVLFQDWGKTWLHAFEFKTSLKPSRVIEQMSRARLVADLIRLWLRGKGVSLISWSYTVLVRRPVSEVDRERLGRERIGVVSWDELLREGGSVMRRILGRDVSEISSLKVAKRRPRGFRRNSMVRKVAKLRRGCEG